MTTPQDEETLYRYTHKRGDTNAYLSSSKNGHREYEVGDRPYLRSLHRKPIELNLLPPGVLWMSKTRSNMIIQEPPQIRMISVRHRMQPGCVCDGYDEETDEYEEVCELCSGDYQDLIESHQGESEGWGNYLIPVPWVLYCITLNKRYASISSIHVSNVEIANEDQVVSTLPLPNVYTHGELCAGNAEIQVMRTENTQETINKCIDGFWSSTFNYDVQEYTGCTVYEEIVADIPPKEWHDGSFFEAWEKLSLEESLRLPWNADGNITLASILMSFGAHAGRATPLDFKKTLEHAVLFARMNG